MIAEALDILQGWPDFAGDFRDPEHFHARIHIPQRLNHMRILHTSEGRVLYTWARRNSPCHTLPTPKHWTDKGKWLWIGDAVWDPGVSARTAVDAIARDLVDEGIASEGEPVLFYRGSQNRFGFGMVRTRR